MADRGEVTESSDKAQVLLETFSPPAVPPAQDVIEHQEQLPQERLNQGEIFRALSKSKKRTAAGPDGLPLPVWHSLLPCMSATITEIFAACTDLAHHPRQWRNTRIVLLKKPGKSDNTSAGSYRPISLLNTLGELLEAVMVRRMSYHAKKYNLLPDTQFGARPGCTTVQALTYWSLPMLLIKHGSETMW